MSILFDGSNDYAWAEGTPPITSHNPCTIALWFKRNDAYAGGGDLMAQLGQKNGDADQLQNYIRMYSNTDGSILVGGNDGTSRNSNTLNTDTTGNWVHGAVVFSGNTTRYSYLAGNTANRGGGTGLVSCVPAAFESVYLGSSPAIGNSFAGYLAHVGMWNLALSSAEIESLAAGANPTTIQPANLQMYYPCTNSGAPGEDTVGGFDLALAGNAVYSADNPTVDPLAVKKLKFTTHPDAASVSSVTGVVFSAPTTGNLTGSTRYGEFTGKTFEASTEGSGTSKRAVLKVPVADFGGTALTTSDSPVAVVRTSTIASGVVTCTVIEE